MRNLYFLIGFIILFGGGVVMYKKTRGIQNNNPGNIKLSNIGWLGKVKGSDPTFETFDTMAHGVRAIGKILITYQDSHGINTVAGLITRYSATDRSAYISNVSSFLAVNPNAPIDVRSELPKLITAIIHQENGIAANFVSSAAFSNGLEMALA